MEQRHSPEEQESVRKARELISKGLGGELTKVTSALIYHIHFYVMRGFADKKPGRYRDDGVGISGSRHEPPPFTFVPMYINQLCQDLEEMAKERSPFELAAYALWRLNWIHPFFEGNGRTARLVADFILLSHGHPAAVSLMSEGDRSRYIDLLAAMDYDQTQSWEPLVEFITELAEKVYRDIDTLTEG